MAGISGKDFKGFLDKFDGWEELLQEKNGNLKTQSSKSMGSSSNTKKDSKKTPEKTLNYTYPSFSDEEVIPDANSEKELGNEYFKQKKYNEAIDCYSRSIALSPTCIAFANRAMAFLKIKRYEEAERDCTEALNLDDRYIKAYSRRSTARKDLSKLREAMEDAEFAVSLEPNTQELRKQYDEIKALYFKEMGKKASAESKTKIPEIQKTSVLNKPITSVTDVDAKAHKSTLISAIDSNESKETPKKMNQIDKSKTKETKLPIQDLASRAVSRFVENNAKNIIVPKNAYDFEVSWRALSNDPRQQTLLLKMIEPSSLPQIFKNALSSSCLMDIIKCTASIFRDETELALSILDNLTKVPRFDMISMCFSRIDRTELKRIWNEVFAREDLSSNQMEILNRLRLKYLHEE